MNGFTINITPIVTVILEVVIGTVVTVLVARLAKFVKEKTPNKDALTLAQEFAYIAVRAAEMMWKAGHGEEKLNYAMNFVSTQLLEAGIELDMDSIRTYIERAVFELNTEFWTELMCDDIYEDEDPVEVDSE